MKSTDTPSRPFGIRVSLPDDDPFVGIIGDNWSTTHWYATQAERDRAMRDMQRTHEYSRRSDKPAIRLEAIRK